MADLSAAYDTIGIGYAELRKPDPRIAARLWQALGEARTVLNEHTRRFHAELVDVIGVVIARLGRTPKIPLEQMTETAIALYMHSIAQEHLGEGTLRPQQLLDTVLPEVVLGLSSPTEG